MAILPFDNKKSGSREARSCSAGQTLIEVLAAFGVAMVLVSAIVVAILSALSNAQFSKNQNIAAQYAQQGIEIMREMRNSDFGEFNTISGNYCLAKACTALKEDIPSCWTKGLGCGQNVDGVFVREVVVQKDSSSCATVGTKVTVSVAWADNRCTNPSNIFCHSAQLVSCLSNINVVPTPGENVVPPTPTPTPPPYASPCCDE